MILLQNLYEDLQNLFKVRGILIGDSRVGKVTHLKVELQMTLLFLCYRIGQER